MSWFGPSCTKTLHVGQVYFCESRLYSLPLRFQARYLEAQEERGMGQISELVGRNIRAARTAKGLTQWQLAERSGLSADFIGKAERGTTSPSIESLDQIAKALELPLRELFPGEGASDASPGLLIELLHLCRGRAQEDIALLLGIARLLFRRGKDHIPKP
jgi:transcriptional regulator with XRE-family HTH domain